MTYTVQFMSAGEYGAIIRFLSAAKEQGLTARGVHDGDEFVRCGSFDDVVQVVDSVQDSTIRFSDADGKTAGSAYVVLGNAEDGSEVIADYTMTPALDAAWNTAFPIR